MTPNGAAEPTAVRGARRHLAAVALAPVLAYAVQVAGGRLLGPSGFAPVSALWTVLFLATTALVVPVEQYVAREVDAGRRVLQRGRITAGVLATTVLLPVALVALTLERAFDGRPMFLPITATMMLGMTIALVARGVYTGRRRFDLYARSIVLEGVARLVLALSGYAVTRDALGMSWGLALGAFLALVGPFRRLDGTAPRDRADRAVAFLGPYVIATIAAQALLASAPLVIAVLGAGAAATSVAFVTFTTLRTPVTLMIAAQARVLSAFLALRAGGEEDRLTLLARRGAFGGLVLAAPAGLLGALVAPSAIVLLFGAAFRPDATFAGLVTAGATLAIANQYVGQASVARGRTRGLAAAWLTGLASAVAVLIARPPLTVEGRVALAFVGGELVTLGLLAAGTRRARVRSGSVA